MRVHPFRIEIKWVEHIVKDILQTRLVSSEELGEISSYFLTFIICRWMADGLSFLIRLHAFIPMQSNITITGKGNIQGTAFCDLFTTSTAYLYQIRIIKLASEHTPTVKIFHCYWMCCSSWHVISVTAVPETNGHWARTRAQRAESVCLGSIVKSAKKHSDSDTAAVQSGKKSTRGSGKAFDKKQNEKKKKKNRSAIHVQGRSKCP